MVKHITFSHFLISTFGAFGLLLLTALFTPGAQAATSQTTTEPSVQLAWWYGPYYGHHHRWHCPKTCWQGHRGKWHCERRC